MHQQKNRWTLSRKQSLHISKALFIIWSMVRNHIHDLGVSLERRYGGQGGRRQKESGLLLFSFSACLVFFDSLPYYNPFLNYFIMWVHKRFVTQWIMQYIAKMWFFAILLQENSPSLSLLNVSLLQYLYFQCWWMEPWPFISNQKMVTFFTHPFILFAPFFHSPTYELVHFPRCYCLSALYLFSCGNLVCDRQSINLKYLQY